MTRTVSKLKVTVEVGDVSIGAIEIKDSSTDLRAVVRNDGVEAALVVVQNNAALEDGGVLDAIFGELQQSNIYLGSTVAQESTQKNIEGYLATIAGSLPPGTLASEATLLTLFKAGQNIGNTTFGASQDGSWTVNVNGVDVNLSTRLSETTFSTLTGSLTETAPATDTASSGLNGRLQRIAQRLTSLIALLPASIGAKLMAGSLSVTMATDQTDIPVKRRAQTDAGGVSNATTTGGVVASLVVKASAGALYKITGWNNQAAVRYIQIFDATALPANGTVPLISYQVAGTSPFELDFGIFGRPFTTGIVVATSTSATTLTVAAANILVDAQYK